MGWPDSYKEDTSDLVTGYRVDSLDSANRTPISTTPDAPLPKAISKMLANDYSQLPVMTTERDVKGTISWQSIGSRLALGSQCSNVRDCMDPPVVIPNDRSLFEAIETVATRNYVLIKSRDGRITGIVTATDLAEQFRDLAEPFLLIGEVENLLRRLLYGKFSADELKSAVDENDTDRLIEGVADLTLGEHQRLLESKNNWARITVNVDRSDFIKRLDRVRVIRNETMHFDPQGIDPDSLEALRSFSKYLRELRRLGAIS